MFLFWTSRNSKMYFRSSEVTHIFWVTCIEWIFFFLGSPFLQWARSGKGQSLRLRCRWARLYLKRHHDLGCFKRKHNHCFHLQNKLYRFDDAKALPQCLSCSLLVLGLGGYCHKTGQPCVSRSSPRASQIGHGQEGVHWDWWFRRRRPAAEIGLSLVTSLLNRTILLENKGMISNTFDWLDWYGFVSLGFLIHCDDFSH